MARFEAKALDLNIEYKTLSGEEGELSPKIVVNTTKTIQIIEQWRVMEKDEAEKKEGRMNPLEVTCIELEMIYPKPKKWWMDNFDLPTLGEIMTHVAETMGGIKKKEKSSKSS